MFDIGFNELLIFAMLSLVILGPEKLPQAAKSAGKWYAKLRHTVLNIQNQIELELDITEARKQMQEELEKIKAIEASMQQELEQIRNQSRETAEGINNSISPHPTYNEIHSDTNHYLDDEYLELMNKNGKSQQSIQSSNDKTSTANTIDSVVLNTTENKHNKNQSS